MKYAVVARPDERSQCMADKVRQRLNPLGYQEDEEEPDTVFVVGGDGTFIYAVHQYMQQLHHVRFYGLHTGTLGFYTDYKEDEFEEFIQTFLDGKCKEVEYPLMKAEINNQVVYAVNEIRIENAARTQVMEIYVNEEKFEVFRGTGICVSTQLGSTAYNRSLGGAVLQEGLNFIQMTEIAGIHHIKYRSLGSPIVMAPDTILRFESESFEGALLGVDSDVFELKDVPRIVMHQAFTTKVKMLKGKDVNYFAKLQSLF